MLGFATSDISGVGRFAQMVSAFRTRYRCPLRINGVRTRLTMTLAHNTFSGPIPAQIRVTVETLDQKGRIQRKISLCNDFPAWAQKKAIERCLSATSVAAGALLTRALPVLQVGTGADVIELDPLDYSGMTCEQLTAQDKLQRIFTSPIGLDFSKRAAELGIKSLNVDEDTTEAYLALIEQTFTTWKALVRTSDSASLLSERQG